MSKVNRQLRLVPPTGKADPIFGSRPRAELEFLPAALEIVETPAPPLPRVLALTLTALVFAAIAWACLGEVDIVSTANGKLVPAGGGKVVQSLEIGTVTAIHVHDGQVVQAGETLVELEPTETLANRTELKAQLMSAQLDVARLRAVALGQAFVAPTGADPVATAVARRQARAQIEEHAAKLSGLEHQIEQHQAELATAKAEAARLRTMLPLAEQRSQVYQVLEKKGYGSRLQFIDAEEKRQDTLRSLDAQEHKMPELEATIASVTRARAEAAAEAAKTDLAALTEAEVKAASLAQDFGKADGRLKDRTLKAPVTGTVQELAIHTVGGVVEPGQVLMRVAPAAKRVEVEARLENKDVGFVRAGMTAQVKIETFPFTRYGLIHAKVISVSPDAVSNDPQQPVPPGEKPKDPDDLHYIVRLALDRDSVDVDGHSVSLTPGMAVTAEVMTGRRRVISFVLSPLAKAAREAGRER